MAFDITSPAACRLPPRQVRNNSTATFLRVSLIHDFFLTDPDHGGQEEPKAERRLRLAKQVTFFLRSSVGAERQ